jgi:ABC-type antimicrobial peptide transport system permease subunit
VIWNIVSISTGERIHELAHLEAIGWSRQSLTRLLLLETAIVTIIGVIFSFPFGLLMTLPFNDYMLAFIPFYYPSIDLTSYIWVGLMTFITTALAAIPSIRRLRSIDTQIIIRERLLG